MNFIRKFFKAAWLMVFKPMVMAPINAATGKISGDSTSAKLNRDGLSNLITLIVVIGLGIYLGPTHRIFFWACVGFGAGIGMALNGVVNVVKSMADHEFELGMMGIQAGV